MTLTCFWGPDSCIAPCCLLQVVTLDIRNFLNVAPDNATTLHRMIQDNLGPYTWPCCNATMTLGELQPKVGSGPAFLAAGMCWVRFWIGGNTVAS
jgi:hypothetical protein